jgi:hypothetical protein
MSRCLIKHRDSSTVYLSPIRKEKGGREQGQEVRGGKGKGDEENCKEDNQKEKEEDNNQ